MSQVRILMMVMFLTAATFGFGQDAEQQPDATNQQERQHPPEAPPPPRPREVNPPAAQPPQEKPQKPEKKETPKPSKEQPKTGREEHQKPTQEGKVDPNAKSVRIPDPQFRANFGRQHSFAVNRVVTETVIVPRQTRFLFAGYTFVFLDPWPAGWLFTDDCFVDFVDEQYFLFDVLHPGVRVALLVVE
ncbi:MAG: hypothetical protein C5B58_03095 [Acidobacteria bacterium]|nr:MAG: hypothetical protein C5B58_03095 [Acidobacteriota bacterium]